MGVHKGGSCFPRGRLLMGGSWLLAGKPASSPSFVTRRFPKTLSRMITATCTVPCHVQPADCRAFDRWKLSSGNEILFKKAPTFSCYRVTDAVGML